MSDQNEADSCPDQESGTEESLPDAIAAVVDVKQEDDKRIQETATRLGVPMLCFIGSYARTRLSPGEEVRPFIGWYDEFAIEVAINAIRTAIQQPPRLDFIINSAGGSLSASYKVARALRKSFDNIRVYVPHVAASGATLIALAGNEIVMGLMSNLSPLDPQVYYKQAMISATTYLKALARSSDWFRTKRRDEVPYPLTALTDSLDPLVMEDFASTVQLAQKYAEDILALRGFGPEESRRIADCLVNTRVNHDEVLHRDVLVGLKLPIKNAEDAEYSATWRVMQHWLAKYMAQPTPVTIIRYALPTGNDHQKESSDEQSADDLPNPAPAESSE